MLQLLKRQFSNCTLYGNGKETLFSSTSLAKNGLFSEKYATLLIGPAKEEECKNDGRSFTPILFSLLIQKV